MQASSYQDIIDNKIAEWQKNLGKLEERARKADKDTRVKLGQTIDKLNEAVTSAIAQLRDLEKQEDAKNTMMIKDKILGVFDSIDRELVVQDKKTPYML